MKVKIKLVAILLMAFAGIMQAQERVFVATLGVTTAGRSMPDVSIRLGEQIGMVLGAYRDLNEPKGANFKTIDYQRFSWSVGFSYAPHPFLSAYVSVENYKKKAYAPPGDRVEDFDTEEWGPQFGVFVNIKHFSIHGGYSKASENTIVGIGFNL